MKKIVLTGASGFVGRNLLQRLLQSDEYSPLSITRRECDELPAEAMQVNLGDITSRTDWSAALNDAELVVHCAARAHQPVKNSQTELEEFRRINTEASLELARHSAVAGVSRFVFISSIGVVANRSFEPLSELVLPRPETAYARSKLEAEQGLRDIAEETGMELVILRPPLIYGPGAMGNFPRLVRAVKRGIPLPLGAVDNRRSFIGIDNLVDFVILSLEHPAAANELFHLSDDRDLSTPELIRLVGKGVGKHVRMPRIPTAMLRFAASAIGKSAEFESLCGNLQVDATKARNLLGWRPAVPIDRGIPAAAESYLD